MQKRSSLPVPFTIWKALISARSLRLARASGIAVADKKMYALRDVTAKLHPADRLFHHVQELASGSDAILLDVTTGTGAFMKTVDQSIELAELMVAIGTHHGRRVAAMITDMDTPLGRNIGNSLEVMESMDVLKGSGPRRPDRGLRLQLAANMLVLAGKGTPAECRAMAQAVIVGGRPCLCQMQGDVCGPGRRHPRAGRLQPV